jgi:hypothetical protein
MHTRLSGWLVLLCAPASAHNAVKSTQISLEDSAKRQIRPASVNQRARGQPSGIGGSDGCGDHAMALSGGTAGDHRISENQLRGTTGAPRLA